MSITITITITLKYVIFTITITIIYYYYPMSATEYSKLDTYLSPAGTATTKVDKKQKQTSPSRNCILESISEVRANHL